MCGGLLSAECEFAIEAVTTASICEQHVGCALVAIVRKLYVFSKVEAMVRMLVVGMNHHSSRVRAFVCAGARVASNLHTLLTEIATLLPPALDPDGVTKHKLEGQLPEKNRPICRKRWMCTTQTPPRHPAPKLRSPLMPCHESTASGAISISNHACPTIQATFSTFNPSQSPSASTPQRPNLHYPHYCD